MEIMPSTAANMNHPYHQNRGQLEDDGDPACCYRNNKGLRGVVEIDTSLINLPVHLQPQFFNSREKIGRIGGSFSDDDNDDDDRSLCIEDNDDSSVASSANTLQSCLQRSCASRGFDSSKDLSRGLTHNYVLGSVQFAPEYEYDIYEFDNITMVEKYFNKLWYDEDELEMMKANDIAMADSVNKILMQQLKKATGADGNNDQLNFSNMIEKKLEQKHRKYQRKSGSDNAGDDKEGEKRSSYTMASMIEKMLHFQLKKIKKHNGGDYINLIENNEFCLNSILDESKCTIRGMEHLLLDTNLSKKTNNYLNLRNRWKIEANLAVFNEQERQKNANINDPIKISNCYRKNGAKDCKRLARKIGIQDEQDAAKVSTCYGSGAGSDDNNSNSANNRKKKSRSKSPKLVEIHKRHMSLNADDRRKGHGLNPIRCRVRGQTF